MLKCMYGLEKFDYFNNFFKKTYNLSWLYYHFSGLSLREGLVSRFIIYT